MSKITCVALLIALSLAAKPGQAQNNAVAQIRSRFAESGAETSFQGRAPIDEETSKKLLELGYFDDEQPKVRVSPARARFL